MAQAPKRQGRRGDHPARKGGFTLIELLTVMVVISILAAIALPKLRGAIDKADAAVIVEDVRTILLAGARALHDTGQFPPDSPAGQMPPGLAFYLGNGFDFGYKDIVPYTWKSDTSGGVSTAFVYVDYSGNAGIARAMKTHEGNNSIWTETQMIFWLSQ